MIKLRASSWCFLGFTAIFAVLAAYVFWGTWSLGFAPVMPDNGIVHPMAYAQVLDQVWRSFLTYGKFAPADFIWDGLLFSPYFCQELKYCSALYLAGLGLAYFLRGRGLKPFSAYGAGLLLAFCGYWSTLFSAGHAGWFQWMTYGVFAFALADRALRKGKLRHWLLLGACVAWGSFYQPDLWLLFTVFTGAYFIWCCFRERKFPWRGMLIAGAALFVIGAASFRSAITNDLASRDKQIEKGETVSSAQASKADDAQKRWIFVTNWSLPPEETAEFFVPRLNGDTSCPLTLSIGGRYGTGVKPYTGAIGRPLDAKSGNYRQHSIYVGWVTCILALIGVAFGAFSKRWDRREVWFFIAAAILCWLFSLGRYCEPVYRLIYALPFGDYLRAPVKWHHLVELALVVLAGYGLASIEGFFGSSRSRLAAVVVGLIAVVGAFDLARVDRCYCAPVDLRQVRRQDANMQFNVLRRADFANPQVAELVRSGRIVSVANYLGNPDYYLVEMLTPRDHKKAPSPMPPITLATWLGILSVAGSCAVIVVSALSRGRAHLA